MATERSDGMIKLAYFLFLYSEKSDGRNYRLPQELRSFNNQKAAIEACFEKLKDDRGPEQFLASVRGDINGFRDWDAGNRREHPHGKVLRQYISADAKREVLWNEIRQYFPQKMIAAAISERSDMSSMSGAHADEPLDHVVADPPDADELLEDDAEFDVQNIRREMETRQKQSVFRQRVLDNFGHQCCLSGVSEPCLLVASHIVPWAKRTNDRLNPRNGILLNVFLDKLFDRGLITFSDDLYVIVIDWADQCRVSLQDVLSEIRGKQASRPKKIAQS